jgi:hypothetical protein
MSAREFARPVRDYDAFTTDDGAHRICAIVSATGAKHKRTSDTTSWRFWTKSAPGYQE